MQKKEVKCTCMQVNHWPKVDGSSVYYQRHRPAVRHMLVYIHFQLYVNWEWGAACNIKNKDKKQTTIFLMFLQCAVLCHV